MHPDPPSSIHLHPAATTSTQLHPASPSSIHPHPAHFNLHPASCNTLNVIRTKISHVIGQCPRFQSCPLWLKVGKHGILEMLIPNPYINFWSSDLKINFWANFGRKSKKMSIFPENWHIRYLEDADFYSDISLLNFQP